MGSSSSQSTSDSTSFIPDYPQAPLLQSIAQYAFDQAPQVYQWGMQQWAANQGNIDGLLRDALSYASPQRISVDMGMAEAGVQQGAEAGRQAAIQDLQSYGIDPSSGRFQKLDAANRVMASASAAGAGNQQRMADIAAGNAMRQQGIAASLQNTALGYQAATAMNALLGTGMSLKYPPLGTVSHGQSTSQSVTDPSGGGGKSPQEQKPKEQPADGGGGGPQQPQGGTRAPSQDQGPIKPGPPEQPTQPGPGNPLDPFAPGSNTLAAPGAEPYDQTATAPWVDPAQTAQTGTEWAAGQYGVDAAGNILGAMPGTPDFPDPNVTGQQPLDPYGYTPLDTSNLFQGAEYDPNMYNPPDMSTSPDQYPMGVPNTQDAGTAPMAGDFAPYNVAGDWAAPPSADYNPQDPGGNTGDYTPYSPDTTDYGGSQNIDMSTSPDQYGGDYSTPTDTSGYDPSTDPYAGDYSNYTDPNAPDYTDTSSTDNSGTDTSSTDTSSTDTSSYDPSSYDSSSYDSGSSDYAVGGPVRRPMRPPQRPTGFRPQRPTRPAPPPPMGMGRRDPPPRPPAAPNATMQAAFRQPLPRRGYMAPSGLPQASPGPMPNMALTPQLARGGPVDPTTGGFVSRSLSPSGGSSTDDVNARLNAGEFVIPKDVAHWKGKEFFYKLIQQARKQNGGGGGSPPPTGYRQ